MGVARLELEQLPFQNLLEVNGILVLLDVELAFEGCEGFAGGGV